MIEHAITQTEHGRVRVVSELMEHLCGSWALQVFWELSGAKTARFNVLKKNLTGITSATLSEGLKEFENDGLVIRKIYPEIPPRVEYSLAGDGKELSTIMGELDGWIRARQRKKLPK